MFNTQANSPFGNPRGGTLFHSSFSNPSTGGIFSGLGSSSQQNQFSGSSGGSVFSGGTGLFGQSNVSGGLGSNTFSSNAGGFGGFASSTGVGPSVFGRTSNTQPMKSFNTGMFGGTTNQQTSSNIFGNQFGNTGGFGSTTTSGSLGSGGFKFNRSETSFTPTIIDNCHVVNIVASNQNNSQEELRWQAYQKKEEELKGAFRPTTGALGQTGGGLFGSTPSSSAFSGQTAASGTGGFGSSTTGSIFGASSIQGTALGGSLFNSGNTFGSNKFANTATSTLGRGGAFGTGSTSLFGSQQPASTSNLFGAPVQGGSGLFSSSSGSMSGTSASGLGLFGHSPAMSTNVLGGPSSSLVSSTPAPTSGSIFGSHLFAPSQQPLPFSGSTVGLNTATLEPFQSTTGSQFSFGNALGGQQAPVNALSGFSGTSPLAFSTGALGSSTLGAGKAGDLFGRTDALFNTNPSLNFGNRSLSGTTGTGLGLLSGGMGNTGGSFALNASATPNLFAPTTHLFASNTASGLSSLPLSSGLMGTAAGALPSTTAIGGNFLQQGGSTGGLLVQPKASSDPYGLGNLFSSGELLLSTGASTSLLDFPYKPSGIQTLISGNSILWKTPPSRLSVGRKYKTPGNIATRTRTSQSGNESFALPESALQSTMLKASVVAHSNSPPRDWLHPEPSSIRKSQNHFTRYKSLLFGKADAANDGTEAPVGRLSLPTTRSEWPFPLEYVDTALPDSPLEARKSPFLSATRTPNTTLEDKVQNALSHSSQEAVTTPITPHRTGNGHVAYEALWPLLTKEGYSTHPSMQTLKEMDETELARVPDFMVKREGYGEILWPGYTDVRQLNIDDIVTIDNLEVSVYNGFEKLPSEGGGLNKKAVIVLKNCRPTRQNQYVDDPQWKDLHKRKVEMYTEHMGAKFISLDLNTWDWKFVVNHFSRYGLPKDWEERIGGMMEDKLIQEVSATYHEKASLKANMPQASNHSFLEAERAVDTIWNESDLQYSALLTESLFSRKKRHFGVPESSREKCVSMTANTEGASPEVQEAVVDLYEAHVVPPNGYLPVVRDGLSPLSSSTARVREEQQRPLQRALAAQSHCGVALAALTPKDTFSEWVSQGPPLEPSNGLKETAIPPLAATTQVKSALLAPLKYSELTAFQKQFEMPPQFALHSLNAFHGRLTIAANGLMACPSVSYGDATASPHCVTLLQITPMLEADKRWKDWYAGEVGRMGDDDTFLDIAKLARQHITEAVEGIEEAERMHRQRCLCRPVLDPESNRVFYVLSNKEQSLSVFRTLPSESIDLIMKGFIEILQDCDLMHPQQIHLDRLIQYQLRCAKSHLNAYTGRISKGVLEACKSIALDTYYLAPYALETWELLEALFTDPWKEDGQPCLDASKVLKPVRRVSPEAIRLSRILDRVGQWLERVNTRTLQRYFETFSVTKCRGSPFIEDNPLVLTIFHLLTSGKVPEAIECLLSRDTSVFHETLVHLMAFIALHSHREIDHDSLELQLNHFRDLAIMDKLDVGILLLYQLLGGVLVDKPSQNALDWRTTFAMHLWFPQPHLDVHTELQAPAHAKDGSRSLLRAVSQYEESFNRKNQTSVIPALPPYFPVYRTAPEFQLAGAFTLKESPSDTVKLDAQFYLLKIFSGLLPFNLKYFDVFSHSPYGLDCSLAWPIAMTLWLSNNLKLFGYSCSDKTHYTLDLQLTRLHTLFASQLEMMGLWHWASFVLMLVPNKRFARSAIREILIRNVTGDHSNDTEDAELPRIRHTVVNILGIPSAWWEEAVALQLQLSCRYIEAAFHFYSAFKKLRAPQLNGTASKRSWYARTIGKNKEEEQYTEDILAVEYLTGCAVNLTKFLPPLLLNIIHREYEDVPEEDRISLGSDSFGVVSFDAKCELILDIVECCETTLQPNHPCLSKLKLFMLCFKWLVCEESDGVKAMSSRIPMISDAYKQRLSAVTSHYSKHHIESASVFNERVELLKKEIARFEEQDAFDKEEYMFMHELVEMMRSAL